MCTDESRWIGRHMIWSASRVHLEFRQIATGGPTTYFDLHRRDSADSCDEELAVHRYGE